LIEPVLDPEFPDAERGREFPVLPYVRPAAAAVFPVVQFKLSAFYPFAGGK
jgi:hypothetical protein